MQQYTPNQQNLQAMLSNLNIAGLKTKIIFTLVMIMVFRLCAQLPLFGIDGQNLANLAATNNLIRYWTIYYCINYYAVISSCDTTFRTITKRRR